MISFADFIYQGKPFLGEATIAKLSKIVHSKSRVLEFGSGGSTVWLAERVALVRTHEGSMEVIEKIYYTLKEKGIEKKVEFVLNAKYPRFDTHYDDNTFDLMIIDGRPKARFECLKASISSLKPSGWVLLDNAEVHPKCCDFMKLTGWPREDTRGWRKTAIGAFWRKP